MKLIQALTVIIMLLSLPSQISAGKFDNTYEVTLQKQSLEDNNDIDKKNLDPVGRRLPSRPILCQISKTCGVTIYGNEDIIITYELWNESNTACIASFSDDTPFCQFLFNTSGNYLIKILTEDYIYIGFISTI